MTFEWRNSLCVSGAKDGTLAMWDINAGEAVKTFKAHKGPVQKIHLYSDGLDANIVVTGGQSDGLINVYDMRMSKLVACEQMHKGSVNFIDTTLSNIIVTGATDKKLKKMDILKGFKSAGGMDTTDAVICGKTLGSLAVVGCGDGNILTFDLDSNQCLFGYGADPAGAINCLGITPSSDALITGGDSGQALKINFK